MSFRAIATLLHPSDDLRALADRHLRDGDMSFDECIRLRHANGHHIRLRLRGHISRDAESNEPYLTAIAAPVEHELPGTRDAEANLRLRDAVETISEAFVLWDDQNRLVMCNSKYQQFHGLTDDDVRPGTPYDAVIAASTEPIVRKRIDVDFRDIDSRTYEAQLEDGRWLHINERRTKDGGFVSVGTDVTILKQNQQRLAENEEQLEVGRHRASPFPPRARAAEAAAGRARREICAGAEPRRGRQPRQVGIPRQYQSRAAHAAECRDRLLRGDAASSVRAARPRQVPGICPRHSRQRRLSARASSTTFSTCRRSRPAA